MVDYTKDVADRVLRILQASGQVAEDKMTEIMVQAESRSAAWTDRQGQPSVA